MVSSVDLIKWACVSETAVPDFIDDPCGMSFVFTSWACSHREDGSPPDALLVLLCKLPLPSSEEFARPSALAAERTSSNLDQFSQS